MQRIEYIDNLRGFAIFLVLLGHIFIAKAPGGTHYPFCEMIYSFHMSLFFFISGYLVYKTNKIREKGTKQYISKKTISLLTPYIFWLFIAPWFIKSSFPCSVTDVVEKFNFVPNLNYWFLPLLFIFYIGYFFYLKIYWRLSNCIPEYIFIIFIIVTLAIIGLLIKQYYMVVYTIYFGAFLFGHILSKYPNIEKCIEKKYVIGISALLLCILWKLFPLTTNGNKLYSLLNLGYIATSSITAIIVFYNIFKQIRLPRILNKYLSEIGKYTMALYLLPIYLFTKDFYWEENYTHALINVEAVVIAVIQSLIAYCIARGVDYIPILRLLLFGKR